MDDAGREAPYDIAVVRHGRGGWRWQVTVASSGRLLMHGYAQERAMARYAVYRALLLLLAAVPPPAFRNNS
jgi:hypothetical protein